MQTKEERRNRAQRVKSAALSMMDQKTIQPAALLGVPTQLTQKNALPAIEFVSSFSQDAAFSVPHATVGVLIFCSYRKPGGGWENGAKAQEEDVSLASTWAVQAAAASPGFYESNDGMGADQVLLAQGYWLYDVNGVPLSPPVSVSFGGVAAPNRQVEAVRQKSSTEIIDVLAKRLTGMFNAWHDAGVQTVVSGAIGCGVFEWKGEDSAESLKQALGATRWKGRLILAMPDPKLEQAFKSVLLPAQMSSKLKL